MVPNGLMYVVPFGSPVLQLNLFSAAKMNKNEYKYNLGENIIQVKDSIPWVRCASGNVCISDQDSASFRGGV